MTYHLEFDDDGAPVRRADPPPGDFEDARPGVAADAQVWGDEPRHDLEAVEDVLDTVLGKFVAPERSTLQGIIASWESVCGPAWSEAKPVRYDDDTLTVEVPNGLLASRLQFDTTRVLAGLRKGPAQAVRTIRFRVKRT
ncbi:MAG: DUF721 domain-containing protein [Acidimicrobiia bacterium]|nr:DUF721 domain-containing protein [Acidimicrobiia bacterium]